MKKTRHYCLLAVIQSALLAVASPVARGQDATGEYVSRKEYEELKAEMLAMKKELASLKKEKRAESNQESAKDQAAADLHKEVAASAVEPPEPTAQENPFPGALGTTKFLLTGFGVGMFEARNGSVSNFSATFNPIFLWELSPKLLFESRLEMELSGSGTNLELEYAQLSYLLNDYITLGAGEFLTPSNVFVERFEALWIDKLPDRPLAVYDGILPERSIGFQVRGGFPIGSTRADYAFYVSNGPSLNAFDASRAGTLEFNNFSDNNDNKAFGGRVGFLPVPGVEVGYGFEIAKPGTQGTSLAHVPSLLQSVDLNITRSSDLLKGRIDLHGQYAWSRVGPAVYDPDGTLGFGPLEFTSKQDGGYVQIAYRPTKVDVDFVRNLELIFRWDHLSRAPSGLGAPEEQRSTLGLDYWLGPSTAVKAAYEWDQPLGEPNRNALLLQVVAGF
jgi:hypothetical protein